VAFGLLMIFLHNLTDGFTVQTWHGPESPIPSTLHKLWMLLHQPFAPFPVLPVLSPVIVVVYPLIPWVGVMAVGYAFGAFYKLDAQRRRRLFLIIGGVVTGLFIVMRAIDVYGDPNDWSPQKNIVYTALSFLNTTKYPPSLLFLLMTLGPSILALVFFESRSSYGRIGQFFITFGRVPLFFYLLQWYTAHLISVLLHLAFGKPVGWLFRSPVDFAAPPPGVGFNLAIVYVAWIVGVLLLYPLCKWFAGVKSRRKDWWLSYL